jgi:hypothetical protein
MNWIELFNAWQSSPDAQPYILSCAEQETSMQDTYEEIAIGLCMVKWLNA